MLMIPAYRVTAFHLHIFRFCSESLQLIPGASVIFRYSSGLNTLSTASKSVPKNVLRQSSMKISLDLENVSE